MKKLDFQARLNEQAGDRHIISKMEIKIFGGGPQGDWYPGLMDYIDLDLWSEEEGLLLLAGLLPDGALVDFGYKNHVGAKIKGVLIHFVQPLGYLISIYDTPYREEVFKKIESLGENIKNHKRLDLTDAELEAMRQKLQEYKKTSSDPHIKSAWMMLGLFQRNLTNIYRLWLGSEHPEGKLPKEFYVQWAVEKKIEITWLEWARERGFFTDISRPLDQNPIMPIYEKRLEVLKIWLKENNSTGRQLETSKAGLWNKLSVIGPESFRQSSVDTIKEFFKKQNLCSFRPGRRKN